MAAHGIPTVESLGGVKAEEETPPRATGEGENSLASADSPLALGVDVDASSLDNPSGPDYWEVEDTTTGAGSG